MSETAWLWVYWTSAALLVYAQVGYLLVLWLVARRRRALLRR